MFDMSSYSVDHAKVIQSQDCLAVTKLLAVDLMARPYMQVGDFFKKLSDTDLTTLMDVVEANDGETPNDQFSDLILISEMLAGAEGLGGGESVDMVTDRANQLISFLIIVSLERKGLVKVHYENMSFGDDMGDKIVVERI
jgi:hypothetical protein